MNIEQERNDKNNNKKDNIKKSESHQQQTNQKQELALIKADQKQQDIVPLKELCSQFVSSTKKNNEVLLQQQLFTVSLIEFVSYIWYPNNRLFAETHFKGK